MQNGREKRKKTPRRKKDLYDPKGIDITEKIGRPPKVPDYGLVSRIASLQCTDEEIASTLGICMRTMYRYKKKKKFLEAIEHGRASGRKSLRRKQWEKAMMSDDTTMLIWLGKNYLNQTDRQQISGPEGGPVRVLYELPDNHRDDGSEVQ